MIVPAGSVLVLDWHKSHEAQLHLGALLQRGKRRRRRRAFGLLERPVLPPHVAADIASYKVFVSGRSGVGKTSLVANLGGLQGPSLHHETTGIQTTTVYWPAKLCESGQALFFKFNFWDCGESMLKKFDHILPACTEKVDGLLLLFSFMDRASFDDLPNQISRVAEGAKNAIRIVIGTKFDQFAHTDVTEHDIAAFRHTWGLPVLRAKSIGVPPLANECTLDSHTGLSNTAHLLNRLAEHLWWQDQQAAGLFPATPGPCREPAPPALTDRSSHSP